LTLLVNLSLATVLIGQFAGPVAQLQLFILLQLLCSSQQLLGNFASLACLDTRNQIIERNSPASSGKWRKSERPQNPKQNEKPQK